MGTTIKLVLLYIFISPLLKDQKHSDPSEMKKENINSFDWHFPNWKTESQERPFI